VYVLTCHMLAYANTATHASLDKCRMTYNTSICTCRHTDRHTDTEIITHIITHMTMHTHKSETEHSTFVELGGACILLSRARWLSICLHMNACLAGDATCESCESQELAAPSKISGQIYLSHFHSICRESCDTRQSDCA